MKKRLCLTADDLTITARETFNERIDFNCSLALVP